MKKIITFSIFAIFLSLLSAQGIGAQTTNSSCPSIAPYMCNNGSCTNNASICDQSWGGGLNTGGTTPSGTTSSVPSTNNSSFGEQCTGNIRYNQADAKACADLAMKQGKALGYDIQCGVTAANESLSKNANPTGESVTVYFDTCTVNGVSGLYGIDLVGYTGTGSAVQRYPGKTGYDANDYIYGSNFQRSAMWNSLPCSLADEISGQAGGGVLGSTLTGSVSCTSGAASYFGSNNPATWNTATAQAKGRLTTTNPGIRTSLATNAGTSLSGTSSNGWYYRNFSYSSVVDEENQFASIQSTDPTTACTGYESTANCHPEWGGGSICNSSMTNGSCRPERVNPYAAAGVAKRAVALGKIKGYTTICSARYVPSRPGLDPSTGLSYYYDIECNLNGKSIVGAEFLLNGSSDWWNQVALYTTGRNLTTPTGTTIATAYNFGTETLRNGSQGESVRELQRFLNNSLNLDLAIDGNLGPKTIAATKEWQSNHGLVADGLIGEKTKTEMNALVL